MTTRTRQELTAVIGVMDAMLEVITAHGPSGCPSGHLYAALMGTISYNAYDNMVRLLVEAKRIRTVNHVLYAVTKK